MADNPSRSVHILSLGCSKNTVDSELLAGHLQANNMTLADSADDADTVVINTCGFIDSAKEESLSTRSSKLLSSRSQATSTPLLLQGVSLNDTVTNSDKRSQK